jgi:NosR/NirI family nitrous oxide reductase transcriptional regulator
MARVASGTALAPQVDIVSGATVTVLVIGDSIALRDEADQGRSVGTKAQSGHCGAASVENHRSGESEIRDWQSLVGDGSVRRLLPSVAGVNEA